jgi:hypothetical protein
MQVNITMTDGAASGTWLVEPTSTATLDYANGTYLQTIYSGNPVQDRQLYGPGNDPMLILKGFTPGSGTGNGSVTFNIEDGPGSFGSGDATWTLLQGGSSKL